MSTQEPLALKANPAEPSLPARQRHPTLALPATPLADCPVETLWELHQVGLELYRSLSRLSNSPESPQLSKHPPDTSWLQVKQALAWRLLQGCDFCVHDCLVDRTAGELGYCRLDSRSPLAGSYLHWGEETPIRPTWALFLSGCTMHCLYCHNWRETFEFQAIPSLDPQALAQTLFQERARYRTISLIGGTPEPHLHTLIDLALALDPAVTAPLVFNSNATLSASGLALMEGLIDIYLPDFKHGNQPCAWQLTKISNYVETVLSNLKAYREQGAAILVRHLALPGHLDCCSRPILEILARDFAGVAVNIMDQYRPMYKAENKPGIDRPLDETEKATLKRWSRELGLKTIR